MDYNEKKTKQHIRLLNIMSWVFAALALAALFALAYSFNLI